MSTKAKDLTKEAPASPGHRIHGYVILARLADKARAEFMGGDIGEYHTDCPLDHMLLDWKGISYDEVKKEILGGADEDALGSFVDSHGKKMTAEEIKAWSDSLESTNPYYNPEKKEWFAGEAKKAGLDPASTTLFQWLDATDTKSA